MGKEVAAQRVGGDQRVHAVDAIRTYGQSVREVLTLLAMVLLTLLVLAWLYRRFLQLPKLVGVFVVDSAAAPEKSVIQLKGKHHRITAKDVPGAGGAKIELFTRRGKPKRVFARVDTPPFFEVEDRRRERVVPEETEIRVNRYRLGSGCCCPRPIRHGLAARCGQARSPREQSRRKRNRDRGALPLIDAGAAPCLGVPEVVQPSHNACNEKRPEAGKPRAQLASLHFGNVYRRSMLPSIPNCVFIVESQFVKSTARRTILAANCPY